ncbi:adenine nucleotide alpha-hydrolase family protein [Aidingimonas lacisalsi]|uniref:adenine nucleotide alpha hydrolase n=1 Tax=Aidingimonas lacisalsi TaxID=2604086 RepID=UPI001F48C4CC|nr:adenine nucleotide alpha hydrolase [Aidingimonas lacisalsi]
MCVPAALHDALQTPEMLVIAVSGGVDSLTLAAAARRVRGRENVTLCHALSPAVPGDASARVRRLAGQWQLQLEVIDAGEFDDPDYLRNPVNRCYYCKTHLYHTMSRLQAHFQGTSLTMASGTNTDDLGDYRPGLIAASEHGVFHPFVDAGMDKAAVRALAHSLGLTDIARLPAAPCLSSRVETGLAVEADTLLMVDAIEKSVRDRLGNITVRCRVRHSEYCIELGDASFESLSPAMQRQLLSQARRIMADHGREAPVTLEAYQQGSAFLHG